MILKKSRSLTSDDRESRQPSGEDKKLSLAEFAKNLEKKMMALGCTFSTNPPGAEGKFTLLIEDTTEAELDNAAFIIFDRRDLHTRHLYENLVVHRMSASIGSSLTQCIIQYSAALANTKRAPRVVPSEAEV
jgi:hypothetical protein